MGISVVANTLISRYLFRVADQTDSIALEADAHHLSTDVWTSLGVFVGLGLMELLNALKVEWGHHIDPIVALGVAALIIRVAVSVTWKSAAPLLDVRLPDGELGELDEMVMNTPKIVGYHKLRTRKSGPYREIDYHLIVPGGMPVEEAHSIAENIEDEMRRRYPGTHVVTHIEPDAAEIVHEPGTHVKNPEPEQDSDDGRQTAAGSG